MFEEKLLEPHFTSVLAPYMLDVVEQKRALGNKYNAGVEALSAFDDFCNEQQLRICDIRIDSLPVVHLLGKGRKSRDVPLTKPCAQVLRQYICENHLDIPERRNDQLFTNPQGKKLTRSGVSYVLAKYIHKANTAVDSFFPQITPHCLRHSKAMHLVEAGKNLIYIRDFLGHESIETTQVYAKANPEARRKALETMDTRMNTPAMPDWNDDPDLKSFLKTL